MRKNLYYVLETDESWGRRVDDSNNYENRIADMVVADSALLAAYISCKTGYRGRKAMEYLVINSKRVRNNKVFPFVDRLKENNIKIEVWRREVNVDGGGIIDPLSSAIPDWYWMAGTNKIAKSKFAE